MLLAELEKALEECLANETGANTPHAVNVQLHPNPAQNFVYITADFAITKVEIFNNSGVRILVEENPLDRINLIGIIDGVYFVRIHGGGGTTTRKLIVN
jgi:hypothetical protein